MLHKTLVAVVIPIHLPVPEDPDEDKVLVHYLTLFKKYPIIFMTRKGLDTRFYQQRIRESNHPQTYFEYFDWNDYKEYMWLLVSKVYYQRFLNYKYILLAHLDAFAFEANLEHWCQRDYDYIGSVIYNYPFVQDYIQSSRLLRGLHKMGRLKTSDFQNGGFSLRKVRSLYYSCIFYEPVIRRSSLMYTEDFFWSVRLPQINPFFRVAPEAVARHFAIELPRPEVDTYQQIVDSITQLPLGCHGWKKYGYSFWKPHLEKALTTTLEP